MAVSSNKHIAATICHIFPEKIDGSICGEQDTVERE
jgi:hypothetical protein